ncbi:stage III sporulation protein AF [Halobacillus locisalis]|uniref:Stage III sporulation protein AF n=1 Tax=Halobacillus locisalis TaxID=220753 RepID=A0A838CPR3_9BACI|nr:stage III sporulation protein AF [Halobacillus locisalis]MBA2173636.1 stage III sporulation protein AF [Halobacillus locisalis]
MELFVEWITRIVLFLLLAMVADTLLPSGLMKKYARLVMSILLLLIFLGPLLQLLQIDPEEMMNVANNRMNQEVQVGMLEDDIEKKKSEILEGQGAYKLEQVTQALKERLEEPLYEEQGLQLVGVEMTFFNEAQDMESLDRLVVTVSEEEQAESTVEDINISIQDDPVPKDDERGEPVQLWIAEHLGLDQEQIEIRWEEEDE